MPANSLETSSRGGEETAGAEAAVALPAEQASGGLKPWLPLLVAIVIMPLLAFAITRFVLIPKIEKTIIARARSEASSETATESASAPVEETDKALAGKAKPTAALTKLLVNVAGTMGTRYLMTSVTLVGKTPDFKTKIEDNKDQLMDLATGVLSSKTISDLEKPSARNEIRAQLLNVFNNAFGGPVVQDIYITEMAIQ